MDEFLKAFSIKEVSERLKVPQGTLRQWEKDFEGVLYIPRTEDKTKSRFYTELEIDTLSRIKQMRDKGISIKMIREYLEGKNSNGSAESAKVVHIPPSVPQVKQSEVVESLRGIQHLPEDMREMFIAMMGEMKNELKNEVRKEIREEIKKEVIEEVRNELAATSEQQKRLLESGQEVTSEKIGILSESLERMEENYRNEIGRRDELLMENMRLMKEMKEKENKGIFKRLFGK